MKVWTFSWPHTWFWLDNDWVFTLSFTRKQVGHLHVGPNFDSPLRRHWLSRECGHIKQKQTMFTQGNNSQIRHQNDLQGWAPESLDSKTGSIWIPCNKSGERLSCIDDNLRMGLHQGSGPRNLGFKTPLDGHYFWNWTQAWKLVSQTMSILLSEDASQFDRKVMPH